MIIKLKLLLAIIIPCIILSVLSGCFDAREIDDLAYPMAIGLDKGDDNLLKITLQLAVPVAIAGGGGEEAPGGGGGTSTIVTIEAPAIYSGINMANTFISKQINLSHAKVIVFSEELAKEGIGKYISAIARGREFRPSMFVMVAKGSAEEYIRAVEPALEANPAKYYEMKLRAFDYTGFTTDATFTRFYHNIKSTAAQSYAILASVSKFDSSKDIDNDESTYLEKGRDIPFEGDFKAGSMPKVGDIKSEVMGLAVFDGDKMVGELDGGKTTSHLMVMGGFNYAFITIPDPIKEGFYVLINTSQRRNPEVEVSMVNNSPHISVKVLLEGDILSIQSGINYEDVDKLKVLEDGAEEFFKEEISHYLTKIIEEYGVDICGFGNNMKRNFLTWREWENFNWLNKFKNSTFDVEVDLKIRRPGLMMRTMPVPDSKGDED
ncbi:UNVERIFIED_CONTAM: spore germination protein KC [Acetivibrio alkalicellulosi]